MGHVSSLEQKKVAWVRFGKKLEAIMDVKVGIKEGSR